MVLQHLVVQHLVAVVQLFQVDVLGQVAALRLQLPVGTLGLLLQRENRGRKAPGQAQSLAFRLRERYAAVTKRVIQDGRDRRSPHGAVIHDYSLMAVAVS